jgi:hypothetical protein
MHGRRAIVGLCMLCALLVSAFAAQSASAVTKGTTLFTCVAAQVPGPETTKGFSDAHCKVPTENKAGQLSNVKFEHLEVPQDEKTHFTYSNKNVGPKTETTSIHRLKATIAGSAVSLNSPEVHCTGFLKNRKHGAGEIPEGEHWIHGTEIVCTFSLVKEELLGCTVTGITAPGGKEMVSTAKLTATSTGKGDSITLLPEVGTLFSEFELTGCAIGPLTIKVHGSLTCKPTGATVICNHEEVTAAKSLRLQNPTTGPVAGYEGEVTITGGKEKLTDPTGTLSVTTVETP